MKTTICIYGGTGAGVTAALQAVRMGQSVVLLEPGHHVGGMNVEGLGHSDIDNHPNFKNRSSIGAMALEFYRRIGRQYGKDSEVFVFEPHVAEAVFADWLAEENVPVRLGCRLKEVYCQENRLQSLVMENGEEFQATVFIDATIEGDLLARAGVTTTIGREPNARYGETKNGIRAESKHGQFQVRVDPFRIPGDASSGVIPTIQDEPLGVPGAGDNRIQAYCFRLCLTDDPANRVPFSKPEGYDDSHYEIYRRYVQAGGTLFKPYAQLPNRKTDLNGGHDLSTNLYGLNHAYPAGDSATRERILREHRVFTQGLCWFLANDPSMPEDVRHEWSRWGTCRDEFTDNAGWPRLFYVRDARRLVSDYVITEHHTRRLGQTPVDDPVALADWPPDTHSVRRIVRDGAAYNEGFVFGGDDWAPFGVSYRALVPRREECLNLITPTCPSSSHAAYGAIRLEWTFMALGQAAGTAAGLAVAESLAVQDVAYPRLRDLLQSAGQILSRR